MHSLFVHIRYKACDASASEVLRHDSRNQYWRTKVVSVLGPSGVGDTNYTRIKDETVGNYKYACKTCGKCFKSSSCAIQHNNYVHLKLARRKCPHCRIVLTSLNLAIHMEEVHGVPAPKCGICSKTFAFNSLLIEHQRNAHMREKNFTCSVCGAQFFYKGHLKSHMSKHSDRKYECDICHKTYIYAKNLYCHKKVHSENSSRLCKICHVSFPRVKSLEDHMKKQHSSRV